MAHDEKHLLIVLLLTLIASTITSSQAQQQEASNARNGQVSQVVHSPQSPSTDSLLASTSQPEAMTTSATTRVGRATSTTRKRSFASSPAEFGETKVGASRRDGGDELGAGAEEVGEEVGGKPAGRGLQSRRRKKLRGGSRLDKEDYENSDYQESEDANGELSTDGGSDKKRRRRKPRPKTTTPADLAPLEPVAKVIGNKLAGGKKPLTRDQEYYDADYEENEAQKSSAHKAGAKLAGSKGGAGSELGPPQEGSQTPPSSNSSSDQVPEQHLDGGASGDPLDGRSPSGLGRRISGILGGDSRKGSRTSTTTTSTTTTTASSGSPSSSSSTVTEASTSTTTTRKPATVVPTANDQVVSFGFNNATNLSSSLDTLDWSKLVKVVLRSARDNQTLYTVVMNSSDLADHPISDWSSEMPVLLQRDFERLIGKWSSVFPKDLLMEDLRNILANAPLVYGNQTWPNRSVLSPLPANGSLADSSNLIPQKNLTTELSNGNVTYGGDSTSNTSFPVHQITNSSFNSSSLMGGYGDGNSSFRELGLAMPTATPTYGKDSSLPLADFTYTTSKLELESLTNSNVSQIASLQTTTNKSLEEFIRNMNEEHTKMQHNVKEQTDSLRHFIMISSVGIVLCTTLAIALIIVLNK